MTCFIGSYSAYTKWVNTNLDTIEAKQSFLVSDSHQVYKVQGLELDNIIATDEIKLTYKEFLTIYLRLKSLRK